jgi:hypothetical protein
VQATDRGDQLWSPEPVLCEAQPRLDRTVATGCANFCLRPSTRCRCGRTGLSVRVRVRDRRVNRLDGFPLVRLYLNRDPEASDKPSDYGPRRWQMERDALGNRNPSDLR